MLRRPALPRRDRPRRESALDVERERERARRREPRLLFERDCLVRRPAPLACRLSGQLTETCPGRRQLKHTRSSKSQSAAMCPPPHLKHLMWAWRPPQDSRSAAFDSDWSRLNAPAPRFTPAALTLVSVVARVSVLVSPASRSSSYFKLVGFSIPATLRVTSLRRPLIAARTTVALLTTPPASRQLASNVNTRTS